MEWCRQTLLSQRYKTRARDPRRIPAVEEGSAIVVQLGWLKHAVECFCLINDLHHPNELAFLLMVFSMAVDGISNTTSVLQPFPDPFSCAPTHVRWWGKSGDMNQEGVWGKSPLRRRCSNLPSARFNSVLAGPQFLETILTTEKLRRGLADH